MRAVVVLVCIAACGGDDAALFPRDYKTSFTEVRNCRPSADHDLHKIRVYADDVAAPIYTSRTGAFPVGALLVKEEFDFTDDDCTGPVANWTVMERNDDAATGGWRWQKVMPDRAIDSENDTRCIGCHNDCGVAPDGYAGTCAVP